MASPNRSALFQNTFTPEEEQHIIYLKEHCPDLSWETIHARFTQHFPKSPRSKGGLQVHYSRKLQPSKRSLSATARSSSLAGLGDSDEEFLPQDDPSTRSQRHLDTPSNRPRRSAIKASHRSYSILDDSDSTLSPTRTPASFHISMANNETKDGGDERTRRDSLSPLSTKNEKSTATTNGAPLRSIKAPSRAVRASRLMTQDRDSSPQMEGKYS